MNSAASAKRVRMNERDGRMGKKVKGPNTDVRSGRAAGEPSSRVTEALPTTGVC